jgi:ribosomal protein L7/L12
MAKVDDVLKMVEEMTVLELSELVKACEEKIRRKSKRSYDGCYAWSRRGRCRS